MDGIEVIQSEPDAPVDRAELKRFLVKNAYNFLSKAEGLHRKQRRILARESARRLMVKIRAGVEDANVGF